MYMCVCVMRMVAAPGAHGLQPLVRMVAGALLGGLPLVQLAGRVHGCERAGCSLGGGGCRAGMGVVDSGCEG